MTHKWWPVCQSDHAKVDTCETCGILRLMTLSQTYYFAQIGGAGLTAAGEECPRAGAADDGPPVWDIKGTPLGDKFAAHLAAGRGMQIIAVPCTGADLMPGDLFSTEGPVYWSRYETRRSIGERVYIRTCTSAQFVPDRNEPIYRIEIVKGK